MNQSRGYRGAERRVPFIVAAGPRQHGVDGSEGRYEVVHRPAYDGVVVHAHVDVYHADRVAYTWRKRPLCNYIFYIILRFGLNYITRFYVQIGKLILRYIMPSSLSC